MNEAQRAALVTEFGAHRLLQLARTNVLAPAGAQFADDCMAAAAAAANNPQRIAGLIAQLNDPSSERRAIARNDLSATGREGAAAVLEALAREADPQRRAALATAAAALHPLVDGPLLAMLSTTDAVLRSEVTALLARLGVAQAWPFVPSASRSPDKLLDEAIARYTAGTRPFATDELNRVELWHWSDKSKRLIPGLYSAEDAQVIWLARLARAQAALRPDQLAYQRRAWVFGLEAAGRIGSLSQGDQLAGLETGILNDVLADALAQRYYDAVVAAADELGRRRDSSVLYAADGQPAPLACALGAANRHVRFAALRAIMAMEPASPFPGSSRVAEALAWFAGGTGERQAIVAMPTNLQASDLVGMLAAHDIAAEAANRGRQAIDAATALSDLEMIFIDMDIVGPDVRQVLYELRISVTTGDVPIVILAASNRLEAAQRLAAEHRRVIAVPRPHSGDALRHVLDQLVTIAARDVSSPEFRATQAAAAMGWLARLLTDDRSFYDVRRASGAIEAALAYEGTAKSSIAALAALGTPISQRAIVHYASDDSLPVASREGAAQAFRASVDRFGLLLTSDEIVAQYDRYNASVAADAQTQRILGQLLDTIESRRFSSLEGALEPRANGAK